MDINTEKRKRGEGLSEKSSGSGDHHAARGGACGKRAFDLGAAKRDTRGALHGACTDIPTHFNDSDAIK